MKVFSSLHKRKAFFLLFTCICFFIAGAALITVGALFHVNPKTNFAGLFKLQPLVNLVSSVFVKY